MLPTREWVRKAEGDYDVVSLLPRSRKRSRYDPICFGVRLFGITPSMTSEDIRQEIDRDPYVPLRLHLSSGQQIDLPFPHMAWVRQNTVLVVHPLQRGTHEIGNYDVLALRLIERIEQVREAAGV